MITRFNLDREKLLASECADAMRAYARSRALSSVHYAGIARGSILWEVIDITITLLLKNMSLDRLKAYLEDIETIETESIQDEQDRWENEVQQFLTPQGPVQ